jgi:hypothetical protein
VLVEFEGGKASHECWSFKEAEEKLEVEEALTSIPATSPDELDSIEI